MGDSPVVAHGAASLHDFGDGDEPAVQLECLDLGKNGKRHQPIDDTYRQNTVICGFHACAPPLLKSINTPFVSKNLDN
jgi:hypothetical protein